MENKDFVCFLTLTKFIDAEVIDYEDRFGITQKGVFIPIEKNGLFKTSANNYLTTLIFTPCLTPSRQGHTHFAKQYLSKDLKEQLNKIGIKTEVVAHLRPKKYGK